MGRDQAATTQAQAAAKEGNKKRVGVDQTIQKKAGEGFDLGAGEAHDENGQGNCAEKQKCREDFDTNSRANWGDRQNGAQNGFPKKSAEAERMRPTGRHGVRGDVNGRQSNGDRREREARDGAFCAAVGHEADAPRGKDQDNRPRAVTRDHEKRRSDRGSGAPKPVACRFVGRRQPAWIVR